MKKELTLKFFDDRGVPKLHVFASDGKRAGGKIIPLRR